MPDTTTLSRDLLQKVCLGGYPQNDEVLEPVLADFVDIAKTITDTMGFALSDKYQNAQRAGLLILLVTLVFNLISLIILTVAAVNIMHTFLMIILERRRELALMRALGATRGAIRVAIMPG